MEVGAALGWTSMIAANYADEVIALEPSSRYFKCAEKNAENIAVSVYQVAAYNECGEIELNISNSLGDDSLLQPDSGVVVTTETVPTRTIESFVHEYLKTEIDFLKVEAEGAEPEVLEGMSGADIEKVAVSCTPERDGESPFDEVATILDDQGYEITDCDSTGDFIYAVKRN